MTQDNMSDSGFSFCHEIIDTLEFPLKLGNFSCSPFYPILAMRAKEVKDWLDTVDREMPVSRQT